MLAALAMAGLSHGEAAPYNWDPSATSTPTSGGAGTWNTSLSNWFNGTGDVVWPNGADEAIFGGTGGSVTLGAPIVANKLTFNVGGYSLSNAGVPANTLTFSGATPTIQVANAGTTATLNTIIAGTNGLTKAGAGNLALTAANTFSGGITVSGGTLSGTVGTGAGGINTFGDNAITLTAGTTLDITPTANTSLAGFSGRVFNTSAALGDTSRIDFTQTANGNGALTATRTDATLNNTATIAGGTNANLGVQWTGKLNITNAGSYAFGTNSDDGSRVYIDGVLVLNNDGPKGVGTVNTSAGVTLSAGLHDIRVDYVNGGGGAGLVLGYSGPDQTTFGAVPAGVIFQAESNTAAGASNAVVVGSGAGNALSATGAGTSTVNLNGSAFTQVQFGSLTTDTGSTLAVTGLAGKTLRVAGATTLGNGAGSVTVNATPNVAFDGVVSDGGNAMTITKSGTGRLIFNQTAAANTLGASTNINVQGGSVVLVGSTATGAFNPIGSAGVTLAGAGSGLVLDTKGATAAGVGNTYANNITVTGSGTTIQDVVNAATTTLSGTLAVNGSVTLDAIAGGQPATDPAATLVVSGPLTGSGTLTLGSTRLGNFTTSAPGVVSFTGNTSGFTGTLALGAGASYARSNQSPNIAGINLSSLAGLSLAGGTLNYLFDGDGTGTPGSSPINAQNTTSQNLVFGDNLTVTGTGTSTIVAGRAGTAFAPIFTQALNKTAKLGTLSIGTQTLAIANNNGYGVDFTGTTTLTGAANFSPATATASNVVPGLTLSGVVSGAFDLTKSGAGTLLLSNGSNTFGGAGKLIDITGGIVAAPTDGALGNAANGVRLNAAGTTNVGFRATGTFATSRTFTLNQATNGIEVTAGNTLTLNSAFAGVSGTQQLVKNDNGVLELAAANLTTWGGSTITAASGSAQTLTGGVLVNAGTLRISNPSALGNTNNIVAVNTTSGAEVQIVGGITVANPLVLNTQAANSYASGINWGGALHSVGSGVTNTWSGAISENQDSGITADASNTLKLTGGINLNAHIGVFGGAGNISVETGAITSVHSLDKIGSGTTNIAVATASPTGNGVRVFAGNLTFSGAAGALASGTVATQILPGGTLNLDSTTARANNRLGGATRPITFTGGNLNIIGNATDAAATSEALAAPNFQRGQSTITLIAGAAGTNLTFGAASNNVSPAQNAGTTPSGATVLFRGTSLGTAAGTDVSSIQWTTGGITFNGQTGAAGSNSKAIAPWAIIDTTATGLGTSFATADTSTSILRPLAANEYSTATSLTANANMLISTALTGQPTTAPNSLTFDAGGSIAMGTVGGIGQTLTLSSGGILVRNGAAATISGGVANQPAANSNWSIHTVGTGTLTISSVMTGGNANSSIGLVKAGDGTLTLSNPTSTYGPLNGLSLNTLNMQTVVNQGKLVLNGGNNTLGANNYLEVGAGGTLDLNGTSQYVLGLFTDGTYNGIADAVTAGGTITSTNPAVLVSNSDARNWAGQITGNVFYNRTGTASTTTIYTPQTYSGGTLLNGGQITLRDYASLASTDLNINSATLLLDNTGSSNSNNRIADSATVTLRSGVINLTGRAQTATTETIGALVLGAGSNNITVAGGGTGVNSADLTFGSITLQNGATLNLQTANGQIGSGGRLLFDTTPTMVNGVLPWGVSGGNDPLTYIPGLGLAALNAPGARGYDGTAFPATAANGTQNIKLSNATFTVPNAATDSYELNELTFAAGAANQAINFTDGADVLNLTSGQLIRSGNFTSNIGATVDSGKLTAGGSGTATGQTQSLYLTANSNSALTVNSRIVNNPNGDAVRLVYTAYNGANTILASASNAYTGGTVVNGGVAFTGTLTVGSTGLIPAGGLTINQATVNQDPGGVIASTNVPVINGAGVLSLTGTNTLAGLVFNNTGGATAPTVNTYRAGIGTNGTGTLTLGASGIKADSSNVAQTSVINGRLDTGANPTTLTINPILVNGRAVAPLQGTLNITGWSGSAGPITKAGDGVLILGQQQIFTGTLNVTAGGVGFGSLGNTGTAANNAAGSRFSRIDLAANTFLNLTNTDATIGSISGSGNVINVAPTGLGVLRTFNVGFDNSTSTFSGSFARWSDALPAAYHVQKLGSGTMTLTGASTTTSNLQVSQGGVTFSGAGTGVFANYIVQPTGVLTLDNSGTNLINRLGGSATTGTLNLGGGEVKVVGNHDASTTETIGTLAYGGNSGMSTITLQPDPAQSLTLSWGSGGLNYTNGSTVLIRGLSSTIGAGQGNLLRSVALNVSGGQGGFGTAATGSVTKSIRPDMLGDASPTGTGTGFISQDNVTGLLYALGTADLAPTLSNASTTNFGLSTKQTISAATAVNTLTLQSGGGVALGLPTAQGNFTANATPAALTLTSGGILAQAGNTGISVGTIASSNGALFVWTPGASNLALTGSFTSNLSISKNGTGSLTLNSPQLNAGQQFNVNDGSVALNGGRNTLAVQQTAANPTVGPLGLHNGTLDLNGNSQLTGPLLSANALSGGTITNTAGGAAVDLISNFNSAQTFGGVIAENLNFHKTGNNALVLTNPSTFRGTANFRANTTTLRNTGAIANASAINLMYGGLNIDQSGLNPLGNLNPTRVAATAPMTLAGGTLTFTSGGSADYSQTINSVTIAQGHNTISVPQAPAGATGALNIGNLVVSPDATLNVTGGTGGTFFNGTPGLNNSNLYITSINGTAIPVTINNKILPANIITSNGEFTTYVQPGTAGAAGQNYGIVTMNGIGAISQTQYDSNVATFPASSASSNVRLTTAGTVTLPTGAATTYNVLALRASGITIAFNNATDVLNLASGGLALTGNTGVVGATVGSGVVTTGGTATTGTLPLYVHSTGATFNSVIADNGLGAKTRLVLNSISNTLTLAGANTYTGGTVVNGGSTVALTGVGAIPAGGLTINGSTVTTSAQNQIAPANAVTLSGSSTLTLGNFANSLASLTFNNTGGATDPAVATGTTSLTLTEANAITAINDNSATTPTVSGTALILSNAAPVINASTTSGVPTHLRISAPITSAGGAISQNSGTVSLTGASTFTNGYNLNSGTLVFGVATTGTLPAVTNGPVGTGTLALANGTAVMSDGTVRVIGNPVSIAGDMTFGPLNQSATALAGNGVTFSNTVTLAAGAHNIAVNGLLNTSTISGVLAGGTDLTKSGDGILTLSGANTYGGTTSVAGGVLKLGSVGAIPSATSDVSVSTGAMLDINGQVDIVLRRLSGSGAVTNSSGTGRTLYVGGISKTDSATAADSTFDGSITNAGGALTLSKVGVGTLTLTGASSFTGNVNIGASGSVPGGQLKITNSLALGTGAKTVSIISNNVPVGNQAQLVIDGSTTNGPVVLGSNIAFTTSQGSLTQPAILNLAGDNTINGNFTLTSGGGSTSIFSTSGKLTLNGNLTPNTSGRFLFLGGAGDGEITGVVDGSGANALGVTKSGSGTWTFSNAANLYTGATLVSDGTLVVGGSISGSATTVNGANAVLRGTGTLGALTLTSGTLAPGAGLGNNPGILNSGNVSFNGGAFALEIYGTSPGNTATSYDQLNVAGTVNIAANTPLTISLGTFNPADDGTMNFTIVNNDGSDALTGAGLFTFGGTPLNNGDIFVASGQPFKINYAGGVNSNSVVLTAVPEPASAALLATGVALLGLGRFCRRRNSASA